MKSIKIELFTEICEMEDGEPVKLLAEAKVAFYLKTNDKIAWIVRENVNLVAIAHTSDFLVNDFSEGATKKVEIKLKLLNMANGVVEREFGYTLVCPYPILEIVCELTATSGYPLLNVFARLEDFRNAVYVFSCPCDCKENELRKEIQVIMERCNRQNSRNFHWGASVSFMKVSALLNGHYWLNVILNQGEFILYEMAVKDVSHTPSGFQVDCVNHVRSNELELSPFSWKLVDFSPDRQNMAVIGRGSYVFYIGLVFLDMMSLTVIAEVQLKGFHFVADAKYSISGNFFLALCSGQQIKMPESDSRHSGIDFEDCKSVVIWDTLGNLLHKINISASRITPLSSYELILSPHDDYFVVPQCGIDGDKRQFSMFLKHTLNFSKFEVQFDAEEILRMYHEKGTENYTSCCISPSGHQLMVTHCCSANVDDRSQDVSSMLVYKMSNSPTALKVLCRVAVRKHIPVQRLSPQEVPEDILSFLNWC